MIHKWRESLPKVKVRDTLLRRSASPHALWPYHDQSYKSCQPPPAPPRSCDKLLHVPPRPCLTKVTLFNNITVNGYDYSDGSDAIWIPREEICDSLRENEISSRSRDIKVRKNEMKLRKKDFEVPKNFSFAPWRFPISSWESQQIQEITKKNRGKMISFASVK